MKLIAVVRTLVASVVLGSTLVGCQTTSLGQRSLAAKGSSGAAMCARYDDRRKDCADQVGCFWDYDQDKCAAN